MDSIFAKLILSFASILGLVSTPAYIQLNTASIVFDYKTGENRPLYYLNVKNIGPQRERFDVSANVPWIFISREGYDSVTSLYLEREGAVIFTLDIRPEMVGDGSHLGQISVKAVDVYDYSVIETKIVEVTFKKNFVPTPSVTASPASSPTLTLAVSPVVSPTLIPTPTSTPTLTPTPSRLPLFSPIPKKPSPSAISPTISPTITLTAVVLPTPSVLITPLPTPRPTVETQPSGTKTLFEGLWQLIRNMFWPF